MKLEKFTTIEGLAASIKTLLSKNFIVTTRLTSNGFLSLDASTNLTISGGVVTATKSYHEIISEASATADDLDTVNGGSEGDILIMRPFSADQDITWKDGTGNLLLAGDFTGVNNRDTITLIYTGSSWIELSRSTN